MGLQKIGICKKFTSYFGHDIAECRAVRDVQEGVLQGSSACCPSRKSKGPL